MVTALSGLCLSQSVSVLVYALGFVSLLVAFLRLSELPLLSFLLNPCYPSLASIHAVPVPVPVPALLSALPSQCLKYSGGWGQIPVIPNQGYGCAVSEQLEEWFYLLP